MVGSLGVAPVASIGRWKCLILADFVVITGSLMTFSGTLHVLYLGRFLYGVSSGAFGVFCSKYITEASPIEIRGSTGALMQLSVVFGIMLPFVIGLMQASHVKLEDMNEEEVWTFIWIVFTIPIVISLLQLGLLLTVFRYDTPNFLVQNGDDAKLRQLFEHIYHADVVEERIANIKEDLKPANSGDVHESVSYYDVCFGARYRRATALGVGIACFQQTTGTNIQNFYSNQIFKGMAVSSEIITGAIGIINFIAVSICLVLLHYLGRRTLMLWGFFVMAFALSFSGLFSLM